MIIIRNSAVVRAVPRGAAGVLLALGAVVVVLLAGVGLGHPGLGPSALLQAGLDPAAEHHVLVTEVRLPRVLLGLLAGAGLAVSGLLVQDALGNRVAGPELLGVSSGAAVVMTLLVVAPVSVPLGLTPWFALAGALAAGAVVLAAVGRTRDPEAVVLVGAAVSAAGAGVVVALVGLGTEGDVVLLMRYLLGSLAARGWDHLEVAAPWLGLGGLAALLLARAVGALALGDEVAAGLGVAVVRTRVLALVVAAVLAAAVAAVCGPVAWVALLAPHVARHLVGTATAAVLPVAASVGGALLAGADLVARLAAWPVELPVGVLTTLLGVPALLLVLHRERARR